MQELNVLRKAKRPETWPYKYVVVEDALPWEIYDRLKEDRLVADRTILARGAHAEQNSRIDLRTIDSLVLPHLSNLWRAFILYHTSGEFAETVRRLFSLSSTGYSTGIRWMHDADLLMECQIGLNTPCTKLSKVRGPHVDNPIELWAGMLYMPDSDDLAGGDLIVYKMRDGFRPRVWGKAEIEDDCVEEVTRVSYKPNMAIFFANSMDAIHGVDVRRPTDTPRYLVNFIGEVKKPLFDYEQYRVRSR